MKTMMREQSAAASAAQRQAEQTVEGRAAARVDFKKNEGAMSSHMHLMDVR